MNKHIESTLQYTAGLLCFTAAFLLIACISKADCTDGVNCMNVTIRKYAESANSVPRGTSNDFQVQENEIRAKSNYIYDYNFQREVEYRNPNGDRVVVSGDSPQTNRIGDIDVDTLVDTLTKPRR